MNNIHVHHLYGWTAQSGIGCYIGHEYYGSLGYADDLKLLCPGLRDLQKMIMICEQYGDRFSVSYNVKKSMCITFDRAVDWSRSRKFNESISITLNGNRLKWVNCVKDLGNYVPYDLSEMEEIRHKWADLIWRANGILARYQDSSPEVKMCFLKAYGCHLYGSHAWCYSDKNVVHSYSLEQNHLKDLESSLWLTQSYPMWSKQRFACVGL